MDNRDEDWFSTARETWPALALDPAKLSAYVAVRKIDVTRLAPTIVADLYLACACLNDAPGSLKIFGERYRALVAGIARRFDPSPAFADEVYQRLNELFFLGNGGSDPRIGRYVGEGPLGGFVATAARRIAFRLAGDADRLHGYQSMAHRLSTIGDQEKVVLKQGYREIFNRYLDVALRRLERRERLILRLNLVEQVSTTKIAAMYNVNQSTISRWIQRAVQQVFETVKELVLAELDLDTRDMASALALVRSQLDMSLSRTSPELPDPAEEPGLRRPGPP